MPWLLASPGHQHPWYWPCRIGKFLSYMMKNFQLPVSCQCGINCRYNFRFPMNNLACIGWILPVVSVKAWWLLLWHLQVAGNDSLLIMILQLFLLVHLFPSNRLISLTEALPSEKLKKYHSNFLVNDSIPLLYPPITNIGKLTHWPLRDGHNSTSLFFTLILRIHILINFPLIWS